MNGADVIDVAQDALWVLIKVAGPVMIVALVVGLFISMFQALTQIQEITLTFVPKIVAIFISLFFSCRLWGNPWVLSCNVLPNGS